MRGRSLRFPLDGRNFIPLMALSPGVALPGGDRCCLGSTEAGHVPTSIFTTASAPCSLNPGQVVFYPIIDAIEEFRINLNCLLTRVWTI